MDRSFEFNILLNDFECFDFIFQLFIQFDNDTGYGCCLYLDYKSVILFDFVKIIKLSDYTHLL